MIFLFLLSVLCFREVHCTAAAAACTGNEDVELSLLDVLQDLSREEWNGEHVEIVGVNEARKRVLMKGIGKVEGGVLPEKLVGVKLWMDANGLDADAALEALLKLPKLRNDKVRQMWELLDVFVHPSVELFPDDFGGEGLRVTEPVAAGTVLIAERSILQSTEFITDKTPLGMNPAETRYFDEVLMDPIPKHLQSGVSKKVGKVWLNAIGGKVFPAAAKMNHCVPGTVATWTVRFGSDPTLDTLVVYAERNLQAGDELCWNYFFLFNTNYANHKDLQRIEEDFVETEETHGIRRPFKARNTLLAINILFGDGTEDWRKLGSEEIRPVLDLCSQSPLEANLVWFSHFKLRDANKREFAELFPVTESIGVDTVLSICSELTNVAMFGIVVGKQPAFEWMGDQFGEWIPKQAHHYEEFAKENANL